MGKNQQTPTVFEARIVRDSKGKPLYEVIDAETGTALAATSIRSVAKNFAIIFSEVNGHDIIFGQRAARYIN